MSTRPGETIGLQKINVQIPTGIAPGPNVEIVRTVSDASTQASAWSDYG